MKICPRCNTQFDDNSKFCPRCGVELQTYNAEKTESTTPTEPTVNYTAPQQYGQPPQYQPPYYTPPMPMYGTQPKAGPQTVLATLKSVCASPVILVALVAFSLTTVFNIAHAFFVQTDIFGNLYAVLIRFGLAEFAFELAESMQDIMNIVNSTSVLLTVIGQLPSILIVLGSWLAYASAANKNGPMKTGGLTLVKVVVIINFVFTFVSLAFIMLAVGVLGAAAADNGYEFLTPRFMAAEIVLFFILAFVVLYYVFLIKTVNAIKNTAQTCTPHYKASVFVAVCLFIMLISDFSSIISAAQALISGYVAPLSAMISALAGICAAVSHLAYGMFIFTYRSRMKKLYDGMYRYAAAPGYYFPPQMNGQGYYQPQQGNGQNNYQPPRQ